MQDSCWTEWGVTGEHSVGLLNMNQQDLQNGLEHVPGGEA